MAQLDHQFTTVSLHINNDLRIFDNHYRRSQPGGGD